MEACFPVLFVFFQRADDPPDSSEILAIEVHVEERDAGKDRVDDQRKLKIPPRHPAESDSRSVRRVVGEVSDEAFGRIEAACSQGAGSVTGAAFDGFPQPCDHAEDLFGKEGPDEQKRFPFIGQQSGRLVQGHHAERPGEHEGEGEITNFVEDMAESGSAAAQSGHHAVGAIEAAGP